MSLGEREGSCGSQGDKARLGRAGDVTLNLDQLLCCLQRAGLQPCEDGGARPGTAGGGPVPTSVPGRGRRGGEGRKGIKGKEIRE